MLFNWSNGIKVSSFMARHHSIVLSVIESKELKIEFDSYTNLYYYPKEKSKMLEIE